jgi:hypothetical protein
VQVLEHGDGGLVACGAEEPRGEHRERPAPLDLGRDLDRRVPCGQRQLEERCDERDDVGRHEPGGEQAPLELLELHLGARASRPEELAQQVGHRVKGVLSRYGRPPLSSHRCGSPPSSSRKRFTRRDLPIPGSPPISTTWPSPSHTRSQQLRKRNISFSRPKNGVRPRVCAAWNRLRTPLAACTW